MENKKEIDWEERRFEVLKTLIVNNSQNLRNTAVINGIVGASKLIIDHYRNAVEQEYK